MKTNRYLVASGRLSATVGQLARRGLAWMMFFLMAGSLARAGYPVADAPPLVVYANGKSERTHYIRVRQGEAFTVTKFVQAVYDEAGTSWRKPFTFTFQPMLLSRGNTGVDMSSFLFSGFQSRPPVGERVTLLPGGGMNFTMDAGGSGPGVYGPVPFATFKLNDAATKKWVSSQTPNGLLPVGTWRLDWTLSQRPEDNQWNLTKPAVYVSFTRSSAHGFLTIEVTDDATPEAIDFGLVKYWTLESKDGRLVRTLTPDRFQPLAGERLKAVEGSLLFSGTMPLDYAIGMSLDGVVGDITTKVSYGGSPTTFLVDYQIRFRDPATNVLDRGIRTLKTKLTTLGGIVLATDALEFDVMAPPSISQQPESVTVNAGQKAVFSIVAQGRPMPSYEWMVQTSSATGFVKVVEGAGFTGATQAKLVVAAAQAAMKGYRFRCVVTNAAGSLTSDIGTLTVVALPTAAAFCINGGVAVTISRTVSLPHTVTGEPQQYLASESPTFANAKWQPWVAAPSFTLSVGNGRKTVYLKVRNAAGESAVVSDAIDLNEVVRPTCANFAINNGAASSKVQQVMLNHAGTGSPTEFMASESASFAGAQWQTWSTAPSFTLSAGNGRKTVYLKVRNAAGESAVVSDAIDLNEVVRPTCANFAINGGAASSKVRQVTLNHAATGVPTEFMASESASFAGAQWQSWSVAPSFTLSAGSGRKTVNLKVRNAAGESAVIVDAIDLK